LDQIHFTQEEEEEMNIGDNEVETAESGIEVPDGTMSPEKCYQVSYMRFLGRRAAMDEEEEGEEGQETENDVPDMKVEDLKEHETENKVPDGTMDQEVEGEEGKETGNDVPDMEVEDLNEQETENKVPDGTMDQEEKGEEGQETGNDVPVEDLKEQETTNNLPDGMVVLTQEELAAIKKRVDNRKICDKEQLVAFHKLLDEMIFQRKKRGVGHNFFCRVGDCLLSKGTRQKMREHIEVKHVDRVEHLCEECHTPHKTSASLSQHLRKIHG
jgi:hypothetical protein